MLHNRNYGMHCAGDSTLTDQEPPYPIWSAILGVAAGTAGLVAVGILPFSVLAPLAEELRVSPGTASQTLSITALVALCTSILVSRLTFNIDKRTLLLANTAISTISCSMAAMVICFKFMLLGRALLGIAIGGVWAISRSIAPQLAPSKDVPKALAVIIGGASMSLLLAIPTGCYLGVILGWRGVFLIGAGVGLLTFAWQSVTIPFASTVYEG